MKDRILAEIRRVAAANGGRPPGQKAFESATGIRSRAWRGRYWARWCDALLEAGFAPNSKKVALSDDDVYGPPIPLIRELGRLPTEDELNVLRRRDATLPSTSVRRRRARTRSELAERLITYCNARPGLEDVVAMLEPLVTAGPMMTPEAQRGKGPVGFVYLIRSGKYYKIGRTVAVGRRERELAIQLPEKASRIHAIETDDPAGIERYWHLRFASRRVRPDAEWFSLTQEDVASFKLRPIHVAIPGPKLMGRESGWLAGGVAAEQSHRPRRGHASDSAAVCV